MKLPFKGQFQNGCNSPYFAKIMMTPCYRLVRYNKLNNDRQSRTCAPHHKYFTYIGNEPMASDTEEITFCEGSEDYISKGV